MSYLTVQLTQVSLINIVELHGFNPKSLVITFKIMVNLLIILTYIMNLSIFFTFFGQFVGMINWFADTSFYFSHEILPTHKYD